MDELVNHYNFQIIDEMVKRSHQIATKNAAEAMIPIYMHMNLYRIWPKQMLFAQSKLYLFLFMWHKQQTSKC